MFQMMSDAKKWREHVEKEKVAEHEKFLRTRAKMECQLILIDGSVIDFMVNEKPYISCVFGIEIKSTAKSGCQGYRNWARDDGFKEGFMIEGTLYAPHQVAKVVFGEIEEYEE